MSRALVLARGQAFAQAGMVDTCTIRRRTGQTSDPVTGDAVPTYLSPDPYAGKCRIQQKAALARPHEVGEDHLLIVRFELQLPVAGTSGLQVGDEVTITAAAHDPDLAGRRFLISELAHKSDLTSRRVGVIEKTGS